MEIGIAAFADYDAILYFDCGGGGGGAGLCGESESGGAADA